MMCKPIVLSSGGWCLPVSFWHRREAASAAMLVSSDQGRTWDERGACDVPPGVRRYDEHMIVERRGGTLWMLVRVSDGIAQSVSTDRGRTWSPLQPTGMTHPSSRFFLRHLASDRLLLVRHDPPAPGSGHEQRQDVRSHLAAFISEDDGETWPYRLLLDERRQISYPDGDQAGDGTIYITYDHQRTGEREILLATFREQDVIQGAGQSADARFRALINKAKR